MPASPQRRPLSIVHTEASCGWGGQEIRILTEAAGMIDRGHRVSILCPAEARIFGEAKTRNIPVEALPIRRKNLRALAAIYRWLKANPVDVINTHSSTDTWLVALASVFLRKPAPLVRTRHISAAVPNNGPTRWLYRRASRRIITTGERLRHELIGTNRVQPETITSVPTGIDTLRFQPGDKRAARRRLGLDVHNRYVGIVATLRSWKGHRYLLDAFAQIARPGLHLLIVGDGPQHSALEQQIQQLRLSSSVTMAGNQDDVVPWMQSLDLFVLPSYANEGVPQALVQAMLCGLPIITTDIGSITEAVEHESTGILVEKENSAAIADAINQILEDEALGTRLGSRARELAAQRFSLPTMLDRMEDVFYEVCT